MHDQGGPPMMPPMNGAPPLPDEFADDLRPPMQPPPGIPGGMPHDLPHGLSHDLGHQPMPPQTGEAQPPMAAAPVRGAPPQEPPPSQAARQDPTTRPVRNAPRSGQSAKPRLGPAANRISGASKPTKPDFSGLPPAMAESLAKLAGVPWPPPADGAGQRELEKHGAGAAPPGKPRKEG